MGSRVHLLPNLITLANAFCGLLALAKAIDALALSGDDPVVFYQKMETACSLVFLGMIFDSLDGFVARMVGGGSEFGAQLDSFSDALTFGVVPAMLGKVLMEHEGATGGLAGNARLHFLASAVFALMAILRLVRFNIDPDPESKSHRGFRGLPSPAAAGTVAATIWLYLVLRQPELERTEGTPTPFRRVLGWMETVDWDPVLDWVPLLVVLVLPALGLLMVSNVRYPHAVTTLVAGRHNFFVLVFFVLGLALIFLAPVPFLFVFFAGYTLSGFVSPWAMKFWSRRQRSSSTA